MENEIAQGTTPTGDAVLVAGGTGSRFGQALPKQFCTLAGKPIILHTLERFLQHPGIERVVIVVHPDHLSTWQNLLAASSLSAAEKAMVQATGGGATRTLSVWNGLQALQNTPNTEGRSGQPALVAIHDAVRPFVSAKMITDSLQSATLYGSGICCVQVKSSIRQRTGNSSRAVDRSSFYHVQTPQTFQFAPLYKAYQQLKAETFTDDASLFEVAGHPVYLVDGSYNNLKITTPEDQWVAEAILQKQQL